MSCRRWAAGCGTGCCTRECPAGAAGERPRRPGPGPPPVERAGAVNSSGTVVRPVVASSASASPTPSACLPPWALHPPATMIRGSAGSGPSTNWPSGVRPNRPTAARSGTGGRPGAYRASSRDRLSQSVRATERSVSSGSTVLKPSPAYSSPSLTGCPPSLPQPHSTAPDGSSRMNTGKRSRVKRRRARASGAYQVSGMRTVSRGRPGTSVWSHGPALTTTRRTCSEPVAVATRTPPGSGTSPVTVLPASTRAPARTAQSAAARAVASGRTRPACGSHTAMSCGSSPVCAGKRSASSPGVSRCTAMPCRSAARSVPPATGPPGGPMSRPPPGTNSRVPAASWRTCHSSSERRARGTRPGCSRHVVRNIREPPCEAPRAWAMP
jgi:hypothetical protein